MPAKHASPKKLRVPEWYVSSFMMDRALDAVVRQIVKLDRRHDIPYRAGYSRDGKTIYIDRHMPKWFTFQARRINTDRFLILHESVEKALIDHLGLRSSRAKGLRRRACPDPGEVVTQFQSDSLRTDSPVRVLTAQPASPVSTA
jgi:hypothetical protein